MGIGASPSSTVSATIPVLDTAAPSVPAGVTATSGAWNSVTVSWTASTDNVAVSSYKVSRNGAVIGTIAGTVASFTDVSTAPATRLHLYRHRVRGSLTNLSGESGQVHMPPATPAAASAAASVTTPTVAPPPYTQKPSVPSALTATSSHGEIDLAWTASTDNIAVAGYTVLRDGTAIATTYSTSFIDTGAAPGTAHTYTVTEPSWL